jgi:hypothetical protein
MLVICIFILDICYFDMLHYVKKLFDMLQAYVCFAGNTWVCDALQLLCVFAATIVFKVQVFFMFLCSVASPWHDLYTCDDFSCCFVMTNGSLLRTYKKIATWMYLKCWDALLNVF